MKMKKHLLALSAAAVLLAPQSVGAEGFGIIEWSAEGMAMGGARMFAENDAANIAFDPASITKVKGEAYKVGTAWLAPHDKYSATAEQVSGNYGFRPGETYSGTNRVGGVWVPHGYYVKQMSDKDWFGVGSFTRFGMVSEWEKGSLPGIFNGNLNELVGTSITPTYARKFDDKWSAAVGAEINFVYMNLEKPLVGRIHGHTTALGWNAAANYAFDDKNEIGLVYRSEITHSMNGKLSSNGPLGTQSAYGVVTLPESWTIGYGHKFNDKTRVELQAMRTNWSSFDALTIGLPDLHSALPTLDKQWDDNWRYAIGLEHKLSDKYSVMAGFAYDEECMPDSTVDFMIPTGSRCTYTIGGQYHDKKHTLGVSLGWMELGSRTIGKNGDAMQGFGYKDAKTWNNIVKMFAISYQRHF